jgi:hypothetical protein
MWRSARDHYTIYNVSLRRCKSRQSFTTARNFLLLSATIGSISCWPLWQQICVRRLVFLNTARLIIVFPCCHGLKLSIGKKMPWLATYLQRTIIHTHFYTWSWLFCELRCPNTIIHSLLSLFVFIHLVDSPSKQTSYPFPINPSMKWSGKFTNLPLHDR